MLSRHIGASQAAQVNTRALGFVESRRGRLVIVQVEPFLGNDDRPHEVAAALCVSHTRARTVVTKLGRGSALGGPSGMPAPRGARGDHPLPPGVLLSEYDFRLILSSLAS